MKPLEEMSYEEMAAEVQPFLEQFFGSEAGVNVVISPVPKAVVEPWLRRKREAEEE